MDLELLALLGDGQFWSGAELGRRIGVSRAAVGKRLQRLEADYGFEFHRVSGKGYRLAQKLSLLRSVELDPAFRRLGWDLTLQVVCDSTSIECRRALAASRPARPLLILAEHQTAGRGRRGRGWVSEPCQNLSTSLLIRVPPGIKDLPATSLVAGLAVARSLSRLGFASVGLKWPNDVYLGGSKVAGVLLELSGDPSDECFLIIGIGINVNMRSTSSDIGQPWTSLRLERGKLVDRTALAISLAEELSLVLSKFFTLGFESLKDEWENFQLWRGMSCSVSSELSATFGSVIGIANDGSLRMAVEGEELLFCAGELSLRPIG